MDVETKSLTVMSQREFLVYGREFLERINAGQHALEGTIMRIGLDQDSDELEKLIALVRTIKGSDDYRPSKD